VLSDERRAEGMASGTLQLDGDDVIDRHTRVPRGPASSSSRSPPTSRRGRDD
jgi:hypothetical protein